MHDPDAAVVDPDGGDSLAPGPIPPSCLGCVELTSGAVDQRFAARFAEDLLPLVQSQRSGGAPLLTPGALTGAPSGTLLRYAIITGDINAQQALMDLLETRISTVMRRIAANDRNYDALQQQDDLALMGDACAGLMSLNRADVSVSSRGPALVTTVSEFLRYAQPLQEALFTENFPAIETVVNHARIFATCGSFAADSNAISLGALWAQVAVSRQAADGGYFDDQGVFDTGRQAYVTLALLDTARALSQSDCSRTVTSVQLGGQWLAQRVNLQGQVDSSGSRLTCQSGSGSVLNISYVFRALAMADALSGAAPLPMDDAGVSPEASVDAATNGDANDDASVAEDAQMAPATYGPLGEAALRVSRYVRANQGIPSCYP